jgi:hypothetical protein
VTISNTGNVTLSITGISITGTNSGDFAQTNTCNNGVAVGSNCAISVTFAPTAVGTRYAYLEFADNAKTANTDSIPLIGQAIQSAPNVVFSPGSLTFSTQNENSTSSPQSVTLTNNGSAALTIERIDTEGADSYDFNETNNCGVSIAAGGSCTILVTFDPEGTGSRTASLVVYDFLNGAYEQVANLNGTAVPPATPPGTYTVTIPASSFGDVHNLNIPVTVR